MSINRGNWKCVDVVLLGLCNDFLKQFYSSNPFDAKVLFGQFPPFFFLFFLFFFFFEMILTLYLMMFGDYDENWSSKIQILLILLI